MTQAFGSQTWTQIKLEVLSSYFDAYLAALKNKSFRFCYVDAFAGSGEIQLNDGSVIKGSAMHALDKNFDRYFFLEKNSKHLGRLREKISEHPKFKEKERLISMQICDCNEALQQITNQNWYADNWRGIMFLDPYALNLEWASLKKICQTRIFDVWYLFSFSSLMRCLKKEGGFVPQHANCLNRVLGTDEWQKILYLEDPQGKLPFEEEDQLPEYVRKNSKAVQDYVIERLKSVFPFVLDKPAFFYNSKNSLLFMLCFACSNDLKAAHQVAGRIAGYLCKEYPARN